MTKEIILNKGLCNLLIETFEFTDEQLEVIDYQISMTQDSYNFVLNRCMELGTAADDMLIGCYLNIRTFCLFMRRR